MLSIKVGIPGGTSGKEPTCQCRRCKRRVWSLGQEDPLEGMATHFNILAYRIPWTEEPGGLLSMGLQRVRHDWSNLAAAAARRHEEKTGEESFYTWGKGHVGKHEGSETSKIWFSMTLPLRSWLVTLRSELPRHWWMGPSLETYHYNHHWLHPESCLQTKENGRIWGHFMNTHPPSKPRTIKKTMRGSSARLEITKSQNSVLEINPNW